MQTCACKNVTVLCIMHEFVNPCVHLHACNCICLNLKQMGHRLAPACYHKSLHLHPCMAPHPSSCMLCLHLVHPPHPEQQKCCIMHVTSINKSKVPTLSEGSEELWTTSRCHFQVHASSSSLFQKAKSKQHAWSIEIEIAPIMPGTVRPAYLKTSRTAASLGTCGLLNHACLQLCLSNYISHSEHACA